MRLGAKWPLLIGLLAAGGAAGCGSADDDTAASDAAASQTPSATAPAGGGPTWHDYMVLRNGRTCTSSAKVGGTRSTATAVTHDVKRTGGLVSFVIDTTTKVEGSSAAPLKMQLRYEEQPDGTLKSNYPMPAIPGFDSEVKGALTMPSVAMLKAGKSVTSELHLLMTPTDEATKDQILALLDDGETAIDVRLTAKLGPAAKVDEVKTDDGVFDDLVGVSTKMTGATIANSSDDTLQQAFDQTLSALKQGAASTYWARGEGQVRVEAAGIPATFDGCTG